MERIDVVYVLFLFCSVSAPIYILSNIFLFVFMDGDIDIL